MDKPLKSVTHAQCDARPTVTFPAAASQQPVDHYQIILLGNRGTNVCVSVNNLPKVVA